MRLFPSIFLRMFVIDAIGRLLILHINFVTLQKLSSVIEIFLVEYFGFLSFSPITFFLVLLSYCPS